LVGRAEVESSPVFKAEFENLASAYLRLAEQAERNTALIVEFELPRKREENNLEAKPPSSAVLNLRNDEYSRTFICRLRNPSKSISRCSGRETTKSETT